MVSPSASPATAASSAAGRANASSTPARIRSWRARIGPSSPSAPAMSGLLPVMHAGYRAQLGGLLLGRRVVEEVAPADLGAGQVLEQPRLPEGRKDLDVEVEAGVDRAVGRRLVEYHHVRKPHPPEVLQPGEGFAEHRGEIGKLSEIG